MLIFIGCVYLYLQIPVHCSCDDGDINNSYFTQFNTDSSNSNMESTVVSDSTNSTNSAHDYPNVDRVPSTDKNFNINSILEYGESPDSSLLFILIRSEFFLNLLILVLIVSFLILIFNKYILNFNLDLITKIFSNRGK
jgi:hypothetical protein